MAFGKGISAFLFFGQLLGWVRNYWLLPKSSDEFFIFKSCMLIYPYVGMDKNHFKLLLGDNSINGNHFAPLSKDNLVNGNHFALLFGDNLMNRNHFALLLGDNLTNIFHSMQLLLDNNQKHQVGSICCTGLHGGTSPPPVSKMKMRIS